MSTDVCFDACETEQRHQPRATPATPSDHAACDHTGADASHSGGWTQEDSLAPCLSSFDSSADGLLTIDDNSVDVGFFDDDHQKHCFGASFHDHHDGDPQASCDDQNLEEEATSSCDPSNFESDRSDRDALFDKPVSQTHKDGDTSSPVQHIPHSTSLLDKPHASLADKPNKPLSKQHAELHRVRSDSARSYKCLGENCTSSDISSTPLPTSSTMKAGCTIQSPIQSKKRTWQTAFPSQHEPCQRLESRVGNRYQALIPPLRKRRKICSDDQEHSHAKKAPMERSEAAHCSMQPVFNPREVSNEKLKAYLSEVRAFLSRKQTIPYGRTAKLPCDTFQILSEAKYEVSTAVQNFQCKYEKHIDPRDLTQKEKQLFGCMTQKFRNKRTGERRSPCISKMFKTRLFRSERKISDLVNHYFQHEYVSDNDESDDEEECSPASFSSRRPCINNFDHEEEDESALSLQMRRPL